MLCVLLLKHWPGASSFEVVEREEASVFFFSFFRKQSVYYGAHTKVCSIGSSVTLGVELQEGVVCVGGVEAEVCSSSSNILIEYYIQRCNGLLRSS